MSLSYQPLKPVLVRDPRTILENERQYAILKSGSHLEKKVWTTTSISQSAMNFSCPPPSGGIIVDRKVKLRSPIRIAFTGDAGVGNLLLNPNRDAPRAFPLSSSMENLKVSINTQAVSMPMSDVIQALLHYNTSDDLANTDYSECPALLDQSQAYSNLFGTVRNPLGSYGDSVGQNITARGAFPYTIVSNTQTAAVVDFVSVEPLFISPLYFGCGNGSGFYNVTNMTFDINFVSNAAYRMWSHDATSNFTSTITTANAQFNNFSPAFSYPVNVPAILMTYITPLQTQILPMNMPITYPYFEINRYPTDTANSIAANAMQPFTSNNIQLNSIPRRIYIYIRERNNELLNSANNPDTYFSIENVNIQFQNKSGLLASATKSQLYEMSVKNHCNMSWLQWSGGSTNTAGTFNKFGTVGSILCLEFATDIGLDDLDAPGKSGQYLLQVQCNATNISARSIFPTMYVVVVAEGTFTIPGLGRSLLNIGVITSENILNAQSSPYINYADIECVNGGNFMSGLKKFGNTLYDGVQKGLKFAREDYYPTLREGIKTAKELVPFMGLGNSCCGQGVMTGGVPVGGRQRGGVVLGGAKSSKQELMRRALQI